MDGAAPPPDPSGVPLNFISMLLQSMSLRDRLTCALVGKAWADAATAATRSIVLRRRVKDLSGLQRWLENHGSHLEVLQLHECGGAALNALPCLQLQNLLLKGSSSRLKINGRVWSDIAAATKLTSVTLECVKATSQQTAVVSALKALPDLEQLTWSSVECGGQQELTDSSLLQKLTKLTALKLCHVAAAEALTHLGFLTGLQHLSIGAAKGWSAAGCPGLQELKALTRLELLAGLNAIPASVSQLTALQQLEVPRALPAELNKLSALTGLTQLRVRALKNLSPESPPLQLPGLQHLEVDDGDAGIMPVLFLVSCTKLRVLQLSEIIVSPGILAATTMLQQLELDSCDVIAADGAAGPVSWQQVFPGPGRLPHLTSLTMAINEPDLQQADMECVVACCSSLQVLHLDTLPYKSAPALARLRGHTSLFVAEASDQQCSSLAQLTGLKELSVGDARWVFYAGLQQLAALEQLTSLRLGSLDCSNPMLREHMSDRPPGGGSCVIINKAPAGQPPDVSARLHRACEMASAADRERRPQQAEAPKRKLDLQEI